MELDTIYFVQRYSQPRKAIYNNQNWL